MPARDAYHNVIVQAMIADTVAIPQLLLSQHCPEIGLMRMQLGTMVL